MKIAGTATVALGLIGIAIGSLWAPSALGFVESNGIKWPFDLLVPFLPIFLTAAGAGLIVRSRR
jgi:hypothetical protein